MCAFVTGKNENKATLLSSDLFLNRKGCWGTTDDFATSFLHFSLFSTALLANSRPVHSLMLSFHLFLCLPCLLPPFTVFCKMVLARPDVRPAVRVRDSQAYRKMDIDGYDEGAHHLYLGTERNTPVIPHWFQPCQWCCCLCYPGENLRLGILIMYN